MSMDITLLEKSDLKESHEGVADVRQKCRKLEDVEESIIRNVSKPIFRYSKEQLLKYRDHPLSLKVPELRDDLKFLFEKEFVKQQSGKDDSEGKKLTLKKTIIPRSFDKTVDKLDSSKKVESSRGAEKLSVTFRSDKLDDSRKTTDVASRLRKEPEICLSPQRKSFNSGCSVQSAKVETSTHPEINASNSNLNVSKQALQKFSYRDSSIIAAGNITRDLRGEPKENRNRDLPPRRIGSGRIISSDPSSFIRNYPDNRTISKDKPQVVYKCTFQKSLDRDNHDSRDRESIWDRQKNVVHYERRKYPEQNFNDDNKNHHRHQWDQQQRVNNFFERRRTYHSDYHRDDDEEKEPEWMREGPDSKHDFIELRGFDDQELKAFRRGGNPRITQISDDPKASKPNTTHKVSPNKIHGETDVAVTVSTAGEPKKSEHTIHSGEEKTSNNESKTKHAEASSMEINLEEIFKAPLPDIISESKSVEASGSRFTRWFKQPETSSQNDESKPKLLEDETNVKNSIIAEMSALNYENDSAQRPSDGFIASSSLMDLFRVKENKLPQVVETRHVPVEPTGKLHSLEEIEAKLRGTDSAKQAALNASTLDRKKKEEESEAFRKLLCQAFKANPENNSVQKLLESNMNINDLAEKIRNENQPRKTGPQGFCNGDSIMNIPNLMQHAAHLSKIQSISSSPQFQHQIQLQQQHHHPHLPQPQQQHHQQHQFQHQQQQITSSDMMRLFQQQQQTRSQQEVFSRMLTSSGGNFSSPTNTSAFGRPPQVSSTEGPFAHVSQEIQMWVNNYNITVDVLKQQETKHLIQRIKHRELTAFQLIEQLKKTAPYQTKFRESALCTLKWLQTQEPLLAVCPPPSMSFAVPPPHSTPASALSHPSQTAPFGENMIQQMMMSQQYRNTPIPDIVYQRDFSVHNQNLVPNNLGSVGNKFSSPQMPSANQTSLRLNSSLMMNATNNGSLNVSNTANVSREDKSGLSPMANLNSPGSAIPKSLSFTPTSVLLKLSAEKENLDHSLTKDNSETIKTPHANNQNTSMRNAFVNGVHSGEGALNRLFLSDVASQPRSSSIPLQNMMSVEELERVQQSVHN